jgi:hypothetical protein
MPASARNCSILFDFLRPRPFLPEILRTDMPVLIWLYADSQIRLPFENHAGGMVRMADTT